MIQSVGIGHLIMPRVTTTTKTFADVITAIKAKGLTITAPVPARRRAQVAKEAEDLWK